MQFSQVMSDFYLKLGFSEEINKMKTKGMGKKKMTFLYLKQLQEQIFFPNQNHQNQGYHPPSLYVNLLKVSCFRPVFTKTGLKQETLDGI